MNSYVFLLFIFIFFQLTGHVYAVNDGYKTWPILVLVFAVSVVFSMLSLCIFRKIIVRIRRKKLSFSCEGNNVVPSYTKQNDRGIICDRLVSILARIYSCLARITEVYLAHPILYMLTILLMQLPVFLACYPGIIYYDMDVQMEQYETAVFITNHPLLHTCFMGFFKELFDSPNPGYGIATLVQLILTDLSMTYALSFAYRRHKRAVLTLIVIAFYGLFPLNTLLALSATKDTLFAALVLVFFIDSIRIFEGESGLTALVKVRILVTTVLMLLFRSNAIYAFIPAVVCIVLVKLFNKERCLQLLTYCILAILLSFGANHIMMNRLEAVSGSIKEMLSVPAQQQARIYLSCADSDEKFKILSYIPDPSRYKNYIADPVKEQLDFDTLDSQAKHFLLDTAIMDLKYPIVAIDAGLFNTQGYWDILHMPYQSEHFFLVPSAYRGGATIESKLPGMYEYFLRMFRKTQQLSKYPIIILFNGAIYVYIFLLFFTKALHDKNKSMLYSGFFPLFYLFTLLLGPSAIIRYCFPFILMAPIILSCFASVDGVQR